jgi:hypothetical protein
VAAVQLIYGVVAGKAASVVAVRKSLTKLMDRNLLQGTTANGVYPHDLVRDFMRRKLGGDGAIREKQRPLVRAVIAAQASGGGWPGALDAYMRLSLQQHMGEALLADPADDSEAQAWVDSSDNVLNDAVVRCAAGVIGASCLQMWAAQHEAAGDLFAAAKQCLCASTTAEVTGELTGFGNQSAAATALVEEALALLVHCDDVRARTLEALVIGHMLSALGFTHPTNIPRAPRLFQLVALGIEVTSPAELFALGFAHATFACLESWSQMGPPSAGKHLDLSGYGTAKQGSELMYRASNECPDDGAFKLVSIVWGLPHLLKIAAAKTNPGEMALLHQLASHDRLQFAISNYDFETHHPLFNEMGYLIDGFTFTEPGLFALCIHGDVTLAQEYLRKCTEQFATHYGRLSSLNLLFGLQNCSDSLYRRAGLVVENLAFLKAARADFTSCGGVADVVDASGTLANIAYITEKWSYFMVSDTAHATQPQYPNSRFCLSSPLRPYCLRNGTTG